jgi:PTH1 family peptidyl-tRNA hydrolase
MKYLFIGLGNVGAEYEHTRHNIGFDVLDELAEQRKLTFDAVKHGAMAIDKYAGKQFYLLKPNTFMNLSGRAFNYWMNELSIPLEKIMVVVDDIALPLGKLRVRGKGSSAGHNGLKDIEQTLGHNKYNRLRFGIGDTFSPGRQIDFVLGKWKENERTEVEIAKKFAADALLYFMKHGLNNAMTQFNQK